MHDVAIAGAGPVGLLLASELALVGCSVIVLEREESPHSPMRTLPLGLRGLNAGSAEALYRRGILEPMLDASGVEPRSVGADRISTAPPLPQSVSHVAGIEPDPSLIRASDLPYRLPSPAAEGFMTSLDAVECVLTEHALALGVEIVRGAPVTAVEHGEESVLVSTGDTSHRAAWLVGCDGGRSAVRRAMQVPTYRRGRVLLAGDAAHIHAPLGGQGLNLGLGDAMNLGWKLAATVRGDAPDELLDSYTAERHPVGAAVLAWSRAQVATMAPGPNTPALRELVSDLLSTHEGALHAYRKTSGLWHRYDLGSTHPLVGRTAPDIRVDDGTTLGDALRAGQGVLLDFTSDRALSKEISVWSERIRVVAGMPHEAFDLSGMLVRPDGVVAWRDDAAHNHADLAGLRTAAHRWFGYPDSPHDRHDDTTRPVDRERSIA